MHRVFWPLVGTSSWVAMDAASCSQLLLSDSSPFAGVPPYRKADPWVYAIIQPTNLTVLVLIIFFLRYVNS